MLASKETEHVHVVGYSYLYKLANNYIAISIGFWYIFAAVICCVQLVFADLYSVCM